MNAILKYLGGKRREIPNFIHLFPQNYDTYIEPFLGGGADIVAEYPVKYSVNMKNRLSGNASHIVVTNY